MGGNTGTTASTAGTDLGNTGAAGTATGKGSSSAAPVGTNPATGTTGGLPQGTNAIDGAFGAGAPQYSPSPYGGGQGYGMQGRPTPPASSKGPGMQQWGMQNMPPQFSQAIANMQKPGGFARGGAAQGITPEQLDALLRALKQHLKD